MKRFLPLFILLLSFTVARAQTSECTVVQPTYFPQNGWNLYAFNGQDFTTNYRGYYSASGESFNTTLAWGSDNTPSDAVGWNGCTVDADNHCYSIKREGFPSYPIGSSIILSSWDDNVEIFVNGVSVYSASCCGGGSSLNVWSGALDATSTIEVRLIEGGGGSSVSFNVVESVQGCTDSNACNYNPAATTSDNSCVSPSLLYYSDFDGDGYGSEDGLGGPPSLFCTVPTGPWSANNGDCDDFNPFINPAAIEICNNFFDDNCDNSTDEGLLSEYFVDADSDGYGAPAVGYTVTTIPYALLTPETSPITGPVGDDATVQAPIGFSFPFYGMSYSDVTISSNGFISFDLSVSSGCCEGLVIPTQDFINNIIALGWWDLVAFNGEVTYFNLTSPNRFVVQYLNVPTFNNQGGNLSGQIVLFESGEIQLIYSEIASASYNMTAGIENASGTLGTSLEGFNAGNASMTNTAFQFQFSAEGSILTPGVLACAPIPGYVLNNTDCSDANPAVNPTATEVCNSIDDDCDAQIDEGAGGMYYADADGDGFGAGTVTNACTQPAGFVLTNTDCNDADAAINPDATEICNGVDDNCNGTAEEGLTFQEYFVDADADGYGTTVSSYVISPITSQLLVPQLIPSNVTLDLAGRIMTYTGISINGATNTEVVAAGSTVSLSYNLAVTWGPNLYCPGCVTQSYIGLGGSTTTLQCESSIYDGYSNSYTSGTFTAPTTPGTYYLVQNGSLDFVCQPQTYANTPSNAIAILQVEGTLPTSASQGPNCNDCTAQIPIGFTFPFYGNTYSDLVISSNGFVSFDLGVSDGCCSGNIVPNADAVNNIVALGWTDLLPIGGEVTYFNMSNPNRLVIQYSNAPEFLGTGSLTGQIVLFESGQIQLIYSNFSTAGYNATAGVENATGTVASTVPGINAQIASISNLAYQFVYASVVSSCSAIAGYALNNTDCLDSNPSVNQAATEVCNSIDDDCDTQIDEGVGSMYYADVDGDGYGVMPGLTTQGNSTVIFTSTGLIINGSNEQIGGMNVQGEAQFVVPADGVYTFDWSYSTNDIDGPNLDPAYYINGLPVVLTDDLGADIQSGSVSVNVTAGSTFGFEIIAEDNILGEATLVITNFNGLSNFTGVQSCTPIVGYVTVGGDCNDNLSGTNPGASEICNTSDDDCDGSVDDGMSLTTYYEDMDMDGYGGTYSVQACTAPNPMYVAQGGDCEDFNPSVNPGATEVCNSIDDDCDTQIDEGVGSMYYADADGDGYGTGTATIACTAPVGMVANNTDCNDNSSVVNPGATEVCNLTDDDCDSSIDEGLPIINYYTDLDGDTFGGALVNSTCAALIGNFVVIGGDCNDANIAVNPGAVEICLNSIDDDCDGIVNDGCLPDQLAGESPATSQYVWTNFYPTCVTQSHTLAGFAPSLSSQSICLTGEDKWHYFTATSEAVSIVVSSSANDILLELQNASGSLIATENAVSGLGGEILNFSGLVSGQVYKVGVRNYNSALGIGAYTICVKMLKRGGCDYGPGPYSLCQYFKATFAGAGAVYTFTFTGITGNAAGNVYTRTQSSDICVLSNVSPSLPYGSTYNVLITSTYNLLDAAGNTEILAVPALSPCTMSTVAQPSTSLRTADQCINGTKFRGAIVASLPWVCGVTNWRWEFTEVNPITLATVGLPIAVNRGAASNFINLGTIAALQNGKTYAVRTAPILASTGSNYQWGPTYYMCIIGSAGMVLEDNNSTSQNIKTDIANEVNMSLYPNPTHGTDVNINLSGVESDNVQIRIVDAMGKQVWSNRYTVNGVLNTNITFERPLANGLYFVEAIFNGEVQTQRLMVQK